MPGPLADPQQADEGARAVLVPSRPDRGAGLDVALRRAGYEVRTVRSVDEAARRHDGGDRCIVILDDGHDDWLRSVSDLVITAPGAMPVLLTSTVDLESFFAAISAGVAGFCSLDADVEAIVRTIDSVRCHGVAIPRSMVPSLVEQFRHARGHSVVTAHGTVEVTDREWDVLRLLLERRSTKEMAALLYVSVGTVRSHISTLLGKLGADDRADAIRLVRRTRRE